MSLRTVAMTVLGLAAVAAAGVWALAPLPEPEELAPVADVPAAPTSASPEPYVALDTAAFGAPLWMAPPPPPPKPAPPAPPPPPPPLRLQLVGIVVEEGGSKAVLYDQDTDVLHIVAAGEVVGRCTVESITAAEVTLRDGHGVRTLALRDDSPRGGGR